MKKKCGKCGDEKDSSEFYTTKIKGKVYLQGWCIACVREHSRCNFSKIFSHRYSHIRERTLGRNASRTYSVQGMAMCTKDEFLAWAYDIETMKAFYAIWARWANNEFDSTLSPSLDRIDPLQPYVIGNIRWLTHSENSAKAHDDKKRRIMALAQ